MTASTPSPPDSSLTASPAWSPPAPPAGLARVPAPGDDVLGAELAGEPERELRVIDGDHLGGAELVQDLERDVAEAADADARDPLPRPQDPGGLPGRAVGGRAGGPGGGGGL